MRREFSTPSPPQLSICESSLSFLLYSCFLCFYTPLPSYPFSFHTLAHSLAHSKTQLLSFHWVSLSLSRISLGGGTDSLVTDRAFVVQIVPGVLLPLSATGLHYQ